MAGASGLSHALVSIFRSGTALVLGAEFFYLALDRVLHEVLLVLACNLDWVLTLHSDHFSVFNVFRVLSGLILR